jgi:hypothetical protein
MICEFILNFCINKIDAADALREALLAVEKFVGPNLVDAA